ncbi:hypothetical protein AYO21_09411 [Fonsecaea monophora]|uniref:BZIP domain-containing protein n=1 Tax=Fonsecaea monophora TaxID=254056 RepID=A0A177EXU2_9EURO|nr:hypothetical protein AYO21_09411 [Fonsecaea monophora]OAG36426.1 hypothetical protein AYO21_09411 [Fonsecaea monophora]
MADLNSLDVGELLEFDQICVSDASRWDDNSVTASPLSFDAYGLNPSTPLESPDQSEACSTPVAPRDRAIRDMHIVVVDQYGRECEVVQTRGENRKAQRAYRARKEAQLKAASSTLAANNSQLRTLTHHNRELLEIVKGLKATVVQLEAENQILKELYSHSANGTDDQAASMLESPCFMSPVPSSWSTSTWKRPRRHPSHAQTSSSNHNHGPVQWLPLDFAEGTIERELRRSRGTERDRQDEVFVVPTKSSSAMDTILKVLLV